ncbi:Nucleolar protein, Nop52 [Giardia duodenalis]|uniref:Nucleolar protein, Nop52 n=1 Tax=Giardia intestinalis (strain ATCC 50803 / WB clone C6) TaxID=184922 RepID=A8BQ33_GIAIC|nr:Nucleolar protein, Nop52 [Giardia intestinalis]KAE8304098.1 Nucleolar protein, Nop52 [Giardia intestinalis]|eukprot:XP_001705576.1 Hypothetical protein GL50803_16658 [Giardia lamblia ATCC 50803]
MSSETIPSLDINRLVWELASDKKSIRHTAFDTVYDGLALQTRREPLDYLAMMRLWKGLYYLLWKEDKVDMQFTLCKRISGLIHMLPEPSPKEERAFMKFAGVDNEGSLYDEDEDTEDDTADYGGQAVLFARCGLETLCREWPSVDYLRQSKVMRLVRDFVYALIERILSNYDESAIEANMLIHTVSLVLLSNSRIVQQASPKSLVIHFSDVWADGIRRGLKQTYESQPFTEEKLSHLLSPWIEYVVNSIDKEVSESIGTNIFSRITDTSYNPPENFAEYLRNVEEDEGSESDQDISLIELVLSQAKEAERVEQQMQGVSTKCELNIKKIRRPWEKRMRGHVGSYRYAEKDPHARPGPTTEESSDNTGNRVEYRGARALSNSEILEMFATELQEAQAWWRANSEAILESLANADQEPAPKRVLRKEEKAFVEAKQYLNRSIYAKYKTELHNVRVSRRGLLVYDPKVHERMLRTEDYAVIKPVLLNQLDPEELEKLFGTDSGILDELGAVIGASRFYAREDMEDTDSIDADRESSNSEEDDCHK